MNIGIFTNNYLPNPYGVTGSVESFRKEFEKRGHFVFIFAPRWENYKDENPNVFRYPSIDIKVKFRFPLPISYSAKMRKVIASLKLDVIHSQHSNLLGAEAARIAKKNNIPLIFTWHTRYDYYAHFAKIIPRKLVTWFLIRQAKKYTEKCDAVVAPTESMISVLKKWGVTNKNIFSVATGVDENEFENPNGVMIRKGYGVEADEILLLLVTRLTEEKNVEFVFRALKNILDKRKKVKFLIVGGGNLMEKLREEFCQGSLENKIFFSGEIKREERKDYFAAGDIFVYGSKSETQGMVVSEAMYLGKPVVAVNSVGLSSLVLNKANGFLVEENEKKFSEAVEKLIDDNELRKRFGENSAHIAREKFVSSVCAEKMLEIYRKCLNH